MPPCSVPRWIWSARRIEVKARGPLAQPQAVATVSVTQWVVPENISMAVTHSCWRYRVVVDILDPPAHQKLVSSGNLSTS
ncbi:MAG: hypothetical protein U5O39_05065 [Gammaproteobacteria bacterium]|nr:hypothetical protein [Gammaproteobacteria bacterium]